MQEANSLAEAKLQYDSTKQSLAAKQQGQFEVTAGNSVFDPTTGQFVGTAYKPAAAGGSGETFS
jgi:hypothetical protein